MVAQNFPGVKLYSSTERKFPGDARNVGVANASSNLLAFTDADCFMGKHWIDTVIAAHRIHECPIIGGVVDNGNPENYIGWAYYFSEFAQWLPQTTPRPMDDIPTTCLTVKRWAWEKYGPFLEDTYCSDTAFNWKAVRDGDIPLFIPSIAVSHINVATLGDFVRRKVFHGRCFSQVRCAEQRFSLFRRVAYILGSPLLPILLFCQRARYVLMKHIYVREFVLSAPLVFAGLVAWSWGEMLGYWSKAQGKARPAGRRR